MNIFAILTLFGQAGRRKGGRRAHLAAGSASLCQNQAVPSRCLDSIAWAACSYLPGGFILPPPPVACLLLSGRDRRLHCSAPLPLRRAEALRTRTQALRANYAPAETRTGTADIVGQGRQEGAPLPIYLMFWNARTRAACLISYRTPACAAGDRLTFLRLTPDRHDACVWLAPLDRHV